MLYPISEFLALKETALRFPNSKMWQLIFDHSREIIEITQRYWTL